MKKYRFILALLLSAGLCASCNKWLTVTAEEKVLEEDLFSSCDGFRTTLNGIYRKMSAAELYGDNLSWGFVSVLGQNYENSKLSVGGQGIAAYNFAEVFFETCAEEIWKNGYNVIANCNILLQQLKDKNASFFYEGAIEKNVIEGEARGLRAMMHLDILRLFAPAPVLKDGAAYIPYVVEYPTRQPLHLPVATVMDSIIADLKTARDLLAENDTEYNSAACKSVIARFWEANVSLANNDLFFKYRGTRLNYFAATALLSRAYLYNGDKANAYYYANEIYQFLQANPWFKFTASKDIANPDTDEIFRKLYDDIFLAYSNSKTYDLYEARSKSRYIKLTLKNTQELFAGDEDDYRYTKLMTGTSSNKISLKWARPGIENTVARYQGPLLPVIRLSELYHILCECLVETDKPRAIALFNELRIARGVLKNLPGTTSADEFMRKLKTEITKESLAEGQTFYLYKRLNEPIFNGKATIDLTGKYVIPIPHSERAN